MSARNRFTALALLAAVAFGCESKEGKELKKRPASRESSAKLAFPPNGTWSSAVMVTESGSFERAYGGRGGVGSATYYYARTFLVLARTGGGEDRVSILSGTIENTGASAVLEVSDRKWRLAVPEDGRGVAFAPEGVEEWRWVALESTRPFSCQHLVLETKGGDPCAAAPRLHDLALEMMAPPLPKSLHPDGPEPQEWSELANLVADHFDFTLLWALAHAALREHSGLVLARVESGALQRIKVGITWDLYPYSGPGPLPSCQEMRADARNLFKLPAIAGSVVASNAAILLAWSNDADAQRAMAAALISQDWAPPATVVRDPEWPRALAWSLASSLGAPFSFFPTEVEAAMIAWLDRESGKPESALALIFALVAHGSPEALKKLADMSVPDLDGGTQGKPDPAWPATLEELWQVGVVDHGALTHDLNAWIRAALKAKK